MNLLSFLPGRTAIIAFLVVIGLFLAGSMVYKYVEATSEVMVLEDKLEKREETIAKYVANQKANAAAIETRNTLIEALAQTETVNRVETVKALEANPDWASQPIPADVLASLRD